MCIGIGDGMADVDDDGLDEADDDDDDEMWSTLL